MAPGKSYIKITSGPVLSLFKITGGSITQKDKNNQWSHSRSCIPINIEWSLNFDEVVISTRWIIKFMWTQGLLKFLPRFRFYIHTFFHKNRVDIFEPSDSNKISVFCFKNLRRFLILAKTLSKTCR